MLCVPHDEPAVQLVQFDALERLVKVLKVPAGHGSAALAPSGQYEPGGQSSTLVEPADSC